MSWRLYRLVEGHPMNYISGWHLVKMLRVGLISSNRANYLLSRCFRNERFSNLKYFSVGLQQSLRYSPTHIHRFSVPSEYCVLKFRIRKESHFSSSPFATIFNNTHIPPAFSTSITPGHSLYLCTSSGA